MFMILMIIIIISTTTIITTITIIITTIIMATILTDNVEGVGVPRGGGEVSLGLVSNLNIFYHHDNCSIINIMITLIQLDHQHLDLTQTLVITVIMIM